jgi:hypothetical protein
MQRSQRTLRVGGGERRADSPEHYFLDPDGDSAHRVQHPAEGHSRASILAEVRRIEIVKHGPHCVVIQVCLSHLGRMVLDQPVSGSLPDRQHVLVTAGGWVRLMVGPRLAEWDRRPVDSKFGVGGPLEHPSQSDYSNRAGALSSGAGHAGRRPFARRMRSS